MSWMVDGVGHLLARYLEKPVQGYEPFTPSDPDALHATLQPGDVLLIEATTTFPVSSNISHSQHGRMPRFTSAPSATARRLTANRWSSSKPISGKVWWL